MPEDNRAVLKRIMEHLYEIFKHEDQNRSSLTCSFSARTQHAS